MTSLAYRRVNSSSDMAEDLNGILEDDENYEYVACCEAAPPGDSKTVKYRRRLGSLGSGAIKSAAKSRRRCCFTRCQSLRAKEAWSL
ncbi:hypothetical protein AVEN_62526-1 [Araneus ventricosus]|uniref:Uncharacterized protein n=1 Tax=Araneus ventricosus TaxID=182803 RepID=A0A4Y2TB80_ARAVE|nr:hypothetical protein AVEN_62526-1 [Araneus ventricosus]